jgi:hypothetical protein
MQPPQRGWHMLPSKLLLLLLLFFFCKNGRKIIIENWLHFIPLLKVDVTFSKKSS